MFLDVFALTDCPVYKSLAMMLRPRLCLNKDEFKLTVCIPFGFARTVELVERDASRTKINPMTDCQLLPDPFLLKRKVAGQSLSI